MEMERSFSTSFCPWPLWQCYRPKCQQIPGLLCVVQLAVVAQFGR